MDDGGIEFGGETLIRPRRTEIDGEGRERESQKRLKLETEEEQQGSNKHGGCGGILDNLISTLSSPKAPKPIDVEVFEPHGGGDDGGCDGGSGGGGGGVINNIISSLFHQKEEEEVAEKNGEGKKEDGELENKVEEESEGEGVHTRNIITNLVPDRVGPASDEASILIHSVVHD